LENNFHLCIRTPLLRTQTTVQTCCRFSLKDRFSYLYIVLPSFINQKNKMGLKSFRAGWGQDLLFGSRAECQRDLLHPGTSKACILCLAPGRAIKAHVLARQPLYGDWRCRNCWLLKKNATEEIELATKSKVKLASGQPE
jgi:hypothetical protein